MGVAEAKSSRTFFDYGIDGSGRNSFCYQDDLKPINEFEVKTTTIDDYCSDNNIDKIDVLKIDVEGYEYNVLQGARKMLESHSIEMIIFEISRQINQTVGGSEKMIDELEKEGYFFYDCHNNRVCSDDLRNIIGHMDVVAINKDDKQ